MRGGSTSLPVGFATQLSVLVDPAYADVRSSKADKEAEEGEPDGGV